MQIQYCEACGTRVDDTESVVAGDKHYCKACAAIHAPQALKPSSQRLTRHTPREATRRITTVQARAITSRHTPIPAKPPTQRVNPISGRQQPVGSPAAIPQKNPAFMWAGIIGAVLLVAIVVAATRGGDSGKQTASSNPPPTPIEQPKKIEPASETRTNPSSSAQETKKPVITFNARDEFAAERFKELQANEKNLQNAYDIWVLYKEFVGKHGSTAPGKQAAERLKTMLDLGAFRTPDAPPPVISEGILMSWSNQKFDGGYPEADKFKHSSQIRLTTIEIPKNTLKDFIGIDRDVVAEVKGYVNIPADDEYTFYLESDDGSVLMVGPNKIIEHPGTHQMEERSGKVSLKAGKHLLRIEYFQGEGDNGLIVRWSSAKIPRQTIPASVLSCAATAAELKKAMVAPPPAPSPDEIAEKLAAEKTPLPAENPKNTLPGLQCEIFELEGNKNSRLPDFGRIKLLGKKTIPEVNFPNVAVMKDLTGRSESFALRMTGFVEIETAGVYKFTLHSDNGSMLYINGARIVDNDPAPAPALANSAYVNLAAGKHPFRIEYFQNTNASFISCRWSTAGGPPVHVPKKAFSFVAE